MPKERKRGLKPKVFAITVQKDGVGDCFTHYVRAMSPLRAYSVLFDKLSDRWRVVAASVSSRSEAGEGELLVVD